MRERDLNPFGVNVICCEPQELLDRYGGVFPEEREPMNERGKCISGCMKERENFFCAPEIMHFRLGKDQKLFQKDQSTSQFFTGF